MFETTRERLARSQHPFGIILQRGNLFEENRWNIIECGIDLAFMRILFVPSIFFLFFFFYESNFDTSTFEWRNEVTWCSLDGKHCRPKCRRVLLWRHYFGHYWWMKNELCLCIKYSSWSALVALNSTIANHPTLTTAMSWKRQCLIII